MGADRHRRVCQVHSLVHRDDGVPFVSTLAQNFAACERTFDLWHVGTSPNRGGHLDEPATRRSHRNVGAHLGAHAPLYFAET
jgi:hypothetical protein